MLLNNKVMKFELDPKSVKFKEILNQDFLELEIKAISTANPNRNGSHFTLESLQKAIPTFYNKPILGSFSVDLDDFRAHESDLDYDSELDNIYYDYTDANSETPLGLIRSSDKVEIYHEEADGLDWIKLTCAIWVKYNYKQVKKLLKSKNGYKKISVEVEVLDAEYDENGVEIIKEFIFDGLTILGDKYETGIADAKAKILDLFEDALFQKKQKALAFAYEAFDKANNSGLQEKIEIPENQDSIYEEKAIVNEEPASEIEMDKEINQEGGEEVPMVLTMQAKIDLLESYLHDFYNDWVWVCDIDETYVYFSVESEVYRAVYSITMNEEADAERVGEVSIDMEGKERVVRSWQRFSEVAEEEKEEYTVEETVKETLEDSVEENFEVSENEESVVTETEVATGEVFTEEVISEETEEATEDFACGEKAEEAEDECKMEDAEEECKLEKEGCESEEECKLSEETCDMAEDDCDDCEEGDCEETFEVEKSKDFIEIDGEQLDVFALFEKYNALQNKVNELSNIIKTAEKEKFIQIGKEFINADDFVDDETKENFVEQITAKCEAYEFKEEKDVVDFAKSLMAMYYYEHQVSHSKSNDFSIGIETQKKTVVEKTDKLSDAISKLNKLN